MSSVALSASIPRPSSVVYRDYRPCGAAREAFHRHDRHLLLAGPAGTGKSLGCLQKLHLCALKYDRMRAVMVRKTRTSLTQTGMVTFKEDVRPDLDGVKFHTGDQEYRYRNGSVIIVGGLDDPGKIMSGQFDMAYVQEATELFESDLEQLDTRLRNGVMPYQQLLADCNPGPPTHWLKRRSDAGATTLLESRHEDNPTLWDGTQWTAKGAAYIGALDALTGVRYLRLRKGIWAAAEGLVYEDYDPAAHLLDRFEIPFQWSRYWAIDFGYANPFVWQAWAVDPDGRAYLYREIYQTQALVQDMAVRIQALTAGEPAPVAVICDHDAEDRATLARYGINTVPAYKAVSTGIQAVQERLRVAGDGKPRLYLLRDSLVQRDERLAARTLPLCTEQELTSYVWAKTAEGRPVKEAPVKDQDHGMDALRYLCAYLDKAVVDDIDALAALAGYTG